jgi:hypothetical protein
MKQAKRLLSQTKQIVVTRKLFDEMLSVKNLFNSVNVSKAKELFTSKETKNQVYFRTIDYVESHNSGIIKGRTLNKHGIQIHVQFDSTRKIWIEAA